MKNLFLKLIFLFILFSVFAKEADKVTLKQVSLKISKIDDQYSIQLLGDTLVNTKNDFTEYHGTWNEDDFVFIILNDSSQVLDTITVYQPLKERYEFPTDDPETIGTGTVDLPENEILLHLPANKVKFLNVARVDSNKQLQAIDTFVFNKLFAEKKMVLDQSFRMDTIQYNGDPDKFINLVFLGDGFTRSQRVLYISSVRHTADYLFAISPFTEYRNYFNVFAIYTESKNTGADHPANAMDEPTQRVVPFADRITYFNSTFDFEHRHRCLTPTDAPAIRTALANFSHQHIMMMLVNSPEYGGYGGKGSSVASLNDSSYEIMVHELGHAFGLLADEYFAGPGNAMEKANMTMETDPEKIKWKNWLGYEGVGIYQHSYNGNSVPWYRPADSCKMRFLFHPFCPVCRQALVEKIHGSFKTPVLSFQPVQTQVSCCSESMKFILKLIKPVPNTLKISWQLNGNSLATNVDSIEIMSNQLTNGINNLSAEVMDTTAFIRDYPHSKKNTFTVSWAIKYSLLSQPGISSNGATTILQGNSVLLTSTTAASYLWSNNATTQSISVSTPGNYFVTVTDANGCSATSNIVPVFIKSQTERIRRKYRHK